MYSQQFLDAVERVLQNEGDSVFIDEANGEFSRYGITLKFLATVSPGVTERTITGLTQDQAIGIYYKYWWQPFRFEEIPYPLIATKIFDLAINMGRVPAIRILQQACSDLGQSISIDGGLGPKTLAAVASLDEMALLRRVRAVAAARYREIAKKPSRAKWLKGWLRRAAQ